MARVRLSKTETRFALRSVLTAKSRQGLKRAVALAATFIVLPFRGSRPSKARYCLGQKEPIRGSRYARHVRVLTNRYEDRLNDALGSRQCDASFGRENDGEILSDHGLRNPRGETTTLHRGQSPGRTRETESGAAPGRAWSARIPCQSRRRTGGPDRISMARVYSIRTSSATRAQS